MGDHGLQLNGHYRRDRLLGCRGARVPPWAPLELPLPVSLFKRFPIFRQVRKIAKSDYYLRHVCPSVGPHGTSRLPVYRFSLNLVFEYFSKICGESLTFVKIRQEERVLHVKTCVHLLYVAELFLKWKVFHTNVVEKIKIHILCSVTFFLKSCCL
jgi:hypothetical protein